MKILRDSGRTHWIHAYEITCDQCDTVYQTETDDDFHRLGENTVQTTCPKCDKTQSTTRHTKASETTFIPWYPQEPYEPHVPWINPPIKWYTSSETKTSGPIV